MHHRGGRWIAQSAASGTYPGDETPVRDDVDSSRHFGEEGGGRSPQPRMLGHRHLVGVAPCTQDLLVREIRLTGLDAEAQRIAVDGHGGLLTRSR